MSKNTERKILFVVRDTRYFISHRLPLAQHAQKHGFTIGLACASMSYEQESIIAQNEIKLFRVPFIKDAYGSAGKLSIFLKMVDAFRKFQPNVVHAITIRSILMAGLVNIFFSIPLVALFAGLGTFYRTQQKASPVHRLVHFFLKLILNRPKVSLIFMNSEDKVIFENCSPTPKAKLIVIGGSGVNIENFNLRNYTEQKSNQIIIMTARLLRDKGVLEFIKAARIVKKSYPEAEFQLVGDIDLANPTSFREDEVRSLCKENNVEWLGYRNNITELLQNADIFCLPSYHEGLSLSLLEASAAGLAIVTTDIAGCRAVIENEVNGLLVPPKTITPLAEAIGRYLADPKKAAEFGRKARETVEENFTSEIVFKKYTDIYNAYSAQAAPAQE